MRQSTNRSRAGGFINIPIPSVGQVAIEDVAHRLSNICRFNGAVREFFSVAQHSVEVSMLCWKEAKRFGLKQAEAGLCGLLHDAKEAFIGDVISPLKWELGEPFEMLDKRATAITDLAFNVVDMMERTKECWHWADYEMLLSDAARWDVFGDYASRDGTKCTTISQHNRLPPPHVVYFPEAIAHRPEYARRMFLDTYKNLRETLAESA